MYLPYRVSTWLPSPGQPVPTIPKLWKTSELLVRSFTGRTKTLIHRLNMEVDLQSLFGFCVQLYSLTETPQPRPHPPHLGSYTKALFVRLERRHLFVTPCIICSFLTPKDIITGLRTNILVELAVVHIRV
jgi:hypothetical protein